MNWKLLLFALSLIVGIAARPAEETTPESSTISVPTSTDLPITKPASVSTTARPKIDVKDETPNASENRELKVGSDLQLTTGNKNNEIFVKESSYHHGVAVPMTLEEYEKEIEREKEMINKAKKKIAMESSTPKDGISTWILLSGSNSPTTRPEMKQPSFKIDSAEKKQQPKNNTMTTKKKIPTTTVSTTKLPKPTPKYNNKLLTKVKVAVVNETESSSVEEVTTKAAPTTKKPQLTTKAKKYTTARPKSTTTTVAPTTAATKSTSAVSVEIIDDDTEEQQTAAPLETSTFLIMEPKDADFNLPADRAPSKATPTKKAVKTSTSTKTKKKKIAAVGTNSTRIKKKSDKKNSLTKLSSKTPEKPITTQIYNYLAREVMPTVGVGLVGLVVTAGLATYFLGGPLTALRRSYDISNRRDDSVAFDRSDDFGNTQNEEEMFGKVIAGMPENSAYRNNIRVGSYRPKAQPYSGYPQYTQQAPKYGAQPQLRYRTIDPYQNAYQNQFPQYYTKQIMEQTQSKSADKSFVASQQQSVQQPQAQQVAPVYTDANTNTQKFNIDSVDMTTNNPEANYKNEYDEIAQNYFAQHDEAASNQVIAEKQNIQEIEPESAPQNEVSRSEKVSIVHAQSVPANHRTGTSEEQSLPTPAALTHVNADEEYQNSIANAILNQKKQFVVGSVVAENFEESQPSIVPEHGPRRRRSAEVKAAKSLENNEIEDDDGLRREAESSTAKTEEHSTKDEVETTTTTSEIHSDDSTTQYTVTYNIENPQNNIFDLFRRILDMKLRMGLNFLQNATLAFQHYLKGVEQRVNTSPLFNPYMKNETAPADTRKSTQHVEAL